MDEKGLLKAFYSDGYKIGMQTTDAPQSKQLLFDALKEMYSQIDELIDSLSALASNSKNSIQCKKGCYYCCHQLVFALNYEMDYLKHFIQNNFSDEKQQEIRNKAFEKVTKLHELKGDNLLNSKHPCPLLENGACSAYSARPMACRIYLSTHLRSCMNFYNKPAEKTSIPALLDFPMRAGRMMNEGFKSALKTGGYKAEEFRIEEKLCF